MTQIVTRQDKADWKTHPVTKEFFKELGIAREAILEEWAAGGYTEESSEGTAQKNACALGNLQMIEQIWNKFMIYGEDE